MFKSLKLGRLYHVKGVSSKLAPSDVIYKLKTIFLAIRVTFHLYGPNQILYWSVIQI